MRRDYALICRLGASDDVPHVSQEQEHPEYTSMTAHVTDECQQTIRIPDEVPELHRVKQH